jgi:hypothetical protein
MNPKRQSILDAINKTGVNVHVLSGDTSTYGEALDRMLSRTKIVLNLHFYHGIMVQL